MKQVIEASRFAALGIALASIGMGLLIFVGPGYAVLFGLAGYLVLLLPLFGVNPLNLDRFIFGTGASRALREIGSKPGVASLTLKITLIQSALFLVVVLVYLLVAGYF